MKTFKDFSINKKLITGFAIIIGFSLIMGGYSIWNIQKVSTQTGNMYDGPYGGVKSILTIKSDIFMIHSLMQNISMSDNLQEIADLSEQMKRYETNVFEQFKIFEKSSSETDENFQTLKNQFISWTPIRAEVTNLCLAQMNQIAGDITNEIGIQHVKNLTATIDALTIETQTFADQFLQQSNSYSDQAILINALLLLFMVLCSIIIAAVTARGIVPPIKHIKTATQSLANGNLEIQLDIYQADEIGALGKALTETIATLNRYIGDISYILKQMAQGNMAVCAKGEYNGSFYPIKESLNEIILSLNKTLHQINTAAKQVAESSQIVNSGSRDLSQTVQEQVKSIGILSKHLGEISLQSEENARNSAQTNGLFEEIKEHAASGSENMEQMLLSMSQITDASHKIQQVVKSIEDIAFQTKVLSLNASIEAARAGRYGRGFSIVAEEVGMLSAQSTSAAQMARELVADSLNKVSNGQCCADLAAEGLLQIVQGIETAVVLVAKISGASKLQVDSINATVGIVDGIMSVVDQTSQIADRSVKESSNMFEQAKILREMMGSFHLQPFERLSSDKKAMIEIGSLPPLPEPIVGNT